MDCLHFCVLTIWIYLDFFVLTVLIPLDVFVLSLWIRSDFSALPLWFSSDAFVLACLDFFVLTPWISLDFFMLTLLISLDFFVLTDLFRFLCASSQDLLRFHCAIWLELFRFLSANSRGCCETGGQRRLEIRDQRALRLLCFCCACLLSKEKAVDKEQMFNFWSSIAPQRSSSTKWELAAVFPPTKFVNKVGACGSFSRSANKVCSQSGLAALFLASLSFW